MRIVTWFRVCRKEGHDYSAWAQVEALPVPFLCCARCYKYAPEELQHDFFRAWLAAPTDRAEKRE